MPLSILENGDPPILTDIQEKEIHEIYHATDRDHPFPLHG